MASDKVFAEEIIDMKNKIEDARGELSLIRAVMNSWEATLTEGMGKIWKCDEYDQFRADFVKFLEEYRKADAALLALLQAGSEARREYEKMEAEIISLNIARV